MNFIPSFLRPKKEPASEPVPPKAGQYDYALLDLLGTDILRQAIAESNIAVADAQRLCTEIREKGMQSAYWGITIAIGLLTVFITAASWKVRLLVAPLFIILLQFLYRVGAHIIYRKENYTGGGTEENLLDQQLVDYLQTLEPKYRYPFFLSFDLKGKEGSYNSINAETERMQRQYERAVKRLFWSIIVYGIFVILTLAVCLYFRAM